MISDSKSALDRLEKVNFDMLEGTHYSKITVSDIISKAGVSRTTFYRYYADIFDVHRKIAARLSSTIINECLKNVFQSVLKRQQLLRQYQGILPENY